MFRTYKVLIPVFIMLPFLFMNTSYAAPPELLHAQIQEYDDDYVDDDDGVPEEEDDCLATPTGEPVNDQGCSIGDICPCVHPWKNHGEFVSCVNKTSKDFVKAGFITNKQKSDYVSEAAKHECPMAPGGPNYDHYGDPYHPPIQHAKDTFEITFAVTGDPQFESMYDENWEKIPFCGKHAKDRLLASQKTVKEINASCKNADPGCMGVIVAGDLTQTTCVQQIIAFRQLFEYKYPGDDGGSIACEDDDYYHRYSWGYKLNYPMFPLIGNHDDKTECDPDCLCLDYCLGCDKTHCHTTFVEDYLDDLVAGGELYEFPIEKRISGTVPESWFKANYAWEWGSFHFISLGLWGFYDGYDYPAGHFRDGNRASVDPDKIDWLKRHLAAVGHDKAIVLFQHFGWDARGSQWWSSDNAKQLINVLCNRDNSSESCGTTEKPRYNSTTISSMMPVQTQITMEQDTPWCI
jgi:hypothetical protein